MGTPLQCKRHQKQQKQQLHFFVKQQFFLQLNSLGMCDFTEYFSNEDIFSKNISNKTKPDKLW